MSSKRFDIVFDGSLATGFDAGQVRSNLAQLFGLDQAALDRLFSGNPIAIKKDLDRQTASKYQAALTKAGAKIQLRLHVASEIDEPGEPAGANKENPAPARASESTQQQSNNDHGLSLAPRGSDLLQASERRATVPVAIDCDHIALETINPFLAQDPSTENQSPNVSEGAAPAAASEQFSLAEPGATLSSNTPVLSQAAAVPPPIDHLDIDPLGVDLGELNAAEVAAIMATIEQQFDLADAGADLLPAEEKNTVQARDIDTSRLTVLEE